MEVYDPKTVGFAKLSLEDLLRERKWVVLFFYPADFTFVCPTDLADLADYQEELQSLGV
ncbi:MAG: redoxin domain-containing protein, partial [Aquificaceae bacterium]|nr:redoxin domain-containing protein [Aquificaceae bacterium]